MDEKTIEQAEAALVPPKIDRSSVLCGGCFFMTRERIKTQGKDPHAIPHTTDVYFCHRNPPRIPDMMSTIPYPTVNPFQDWCGEFSPWQAHAVKEEDDGQEVTAEEGKEEAEVQPAQVEA